MFLKTIGNQLNRFEEIIETQDHIKTTFVKKDNKPLFKPFEFYKKFLDNLHIDRALIDRISQKVKENLVVPKTPQPSHRRINMVKGEISSEAETNELIKIFKEPPNQTDMRIINKQVSRKPSKEKFYHSKRGTYGNYRMNETKRQRHIQRMMNKEAQKKLEPPYQAKSVCFKCGKEGHYKKDCRVKQKINNLNVAKDLKDMLNSTVSETRTDSDNEDDINLLDSSGEEISSQTASDQEECIKSNCDCQPKIINVIS